MPDLFSKNDSHKALDNLAQSLNKSMELSYLASGSATPVWRVDGNVVKFVGQLNLDYFGAFKGWLKEQSMSSKADFCFSGRESENIISMIKVLPAVPCPDIQLMPRRAPIADLGAHLRCDAFVNLS